MDRALMGRTYIISMVFAVSLLPVPACADDIILKESGRVITGKILEEKAGMLTVKMAKGGTCVIPSDWVKTIIKKDIADGNLYTVGDTYQNKLKAMDQKSAEDHLALAEWCLKNGTPENGLLFASESHFNIAKQIDPNSAKRASEDLLKAREKTAERSYSIAELEYDNNEYIKSEREALSIISAYGETKYASKARDLLVKIWGRDRAAMLLEPKDGLLPDVVYTEEDLQSVLYNLQNDEQRELYILKCIAKAKDCEDRSDEVPAGRRAGYYRIGIDCCRNALSSAKPEVRAIADSKMQALLKKFFADAPVPYSDYNFSLVSNMMFLVRDHQLVQDISAQYSKMGDDLFKKARRLKQPEKGKNAMAAYFSYSIASNFSKDGKTKENAIEKMIECQALDRARR